MSRHAVLPDAVGRELRDRARKTGRSLNRTAIELIEQAKGVRSAGNRKRRDLSRFAGNWSAEEAAAFDRAMVLFEQVDPEVWDQ